MPTEQELSLLRDVVTGEIRGRLIAVEQSQSRIEAATNYRFDAIEKKQDEMNAMLSSWGGQQKLAGWFIATLIAIGGLVGMFIHSFVPGK